MHLNGLPILTVRLVVVLHEQKRVACDVAVELDFWSAIMKGDMPQEDNKGHVLHTPIPLVLEQ